jgi:hypothetical protein
VARIVAKFAEWRSTNNFGSFGDGVMHALLLIALWGVYVIVILYLLKSMRLLNDASEWIKLPPTARAATPPPFPTTQNHDDVPGDEVCFLMPEGESEEI